MDEWGVVAKGIANGKSYIRFSKARQGREPASHRSLCSSPFSRAWQVQLTRPRAAAAESDHAGRVEAVVFEVSDRELIGYQPGGGSPRRYCCDEALGPALNCTPGRLIVRRRSPGDEWPFHTDVVFEGNRTTAYAEDEAVTIDATGMYHLWFTACDQRLAGVGITGLTAWKNPGGYLPGMMSYYLPFFGVMSLAYLATAFGWLALSIAAWRHILPLQHCISAAIALGAVEMAVWYYDYVNFNATGFRPYATTVAAVLIGAARKTLLRMLLLVVAMGFGVVRPTLGGLSAQVLVLGAAYYCGTCVLDVLTNVGTIDDLTAPARMFLILPVACLDAAFIMWIFTALSRTLAQLQARRQAAKLGLYRSYTNLLAVSAVISVLWVGYEMFFKMSDSFNERWRLDWVTGAFWHVLNLALVLGIAVLWAPTDTAAQYGWTEGQGEDWDDEAGDKGGTNTVEAAAAVFLVGDDDDEPAAAMEKQN